MLTHEGSGMLLLREGSAAAGKDGTAWSRRLAEPSTPGSESQLLTEQAW